MWECGSGTLTRTIASLTYVSEADITCITRGRSQSSWVALHRVAFLPFPFLNRKHFTILVLYRLPVLFNNCVNTNSLLISAMSTNNFTTKSATKQQPPNAIPSHSKDALLFSLPVHQDDSDISSNAGSSSSSRRRRNRRRNRNKNANSLLGLSGETNNSGNGDFGGIGAKVGGKEKEECKPVRLEIGLDLDVELELKAKIRGKVTLSLV